MISVDSLRHIINIHLQFTIIYLLLYMDYSDVFNT